MRYRTFSLRDGCLLILGVGLYTLAFPPLSWSWAAWCALAPLFLVIRDKTGMSAFFVGLMYGVLWCMGQGFWLYGTMTEHFSLSPAFSLPFLLINFLVFAGLPTGVVAVLTSRIMRCGSPLLAACGAPALWVSGEFLRANPAFGVSWGILGYTQYQHLALIQIADVTSVYGISFLLALGGYVIVEVWRAFLAYRQQGTGNGHRARKGTNSSAFRTAHSAFWPAASLLLASLVVTLSYGAWRLHQYADPPQATPLQVTVIQADVPSEQRWKPMYYASTLLKYASTTSRGLTGRQTDLIIWPEFAISFYLDKEPLLGAQLGQFAQMLQSPLLLGAPRLEETTDGPRYYNSAYLFSATGDLVDIYDKLRLVPFAEFRPFSLPSLLRHSPDAPSEFTPGTRETIFSLPSGVFGVTICYEAAYPSLTRHLTRSGAQFLVNISNDTWLTGAAAAVEQHLAMNVLRAVENKRALVRAATAGISGFITPTGQLTAPSTRTEAVLHGALSPVNALTLYTRWGDWFSFGCVGFSLFTSIWTARRSLRAKREITSPSTPKRTPQPQTAHATV